VKPAKLSFAATAIGASRTREVTLSNAGSTQIAIGGLSTSGDFILNQSCGPILLPGQSCKMSVTFAPMVKGRRGGMINVADNAAGAPHLVRLDGHATARRRRK
jgi:trimeric autotransporter adhesin